MWNPRQITYVCRAGLPDGLFSNQKSQFGQILEGIELKAAGILYGHLVNFPSIWYILRHFGIFCGNLVYILRFGILYHEKSGNPDVRCLNGWKQNKSDQETNLRKF
jgi:hypothetical protein